VDKLASKANPEIVKPLPYGWRKNNKLIHFTMPVERAEKVES
jgi:hypothetical protein